MMKMGTPAQMPAWVNAALEVELEGISRKALAARAEEISRSYRAGGNSAGTRSREDALAYALVRMPATYAAVRHAMAQARERCGEFAPQSVLDVGAGPGTATWAALDTWTSIRKV